MSIQERTAAFEQIAAGALVPWLCRVKALGGGLSTAEQIALELGAPPELAAKIKAAVGAESVGTMPAFAGSSTALTAFISQASESSLLLRMFADRAALTVPLRTRLLSMGLNATAAVVGEGLPFPIQGLPYEAPVTVQPFNIVAAIVATQELWENTTSEGQAFINAQLRAAVASAADQELFDKLTNSGTDDLLVGMDSGGHVDATELIDALRAAMDAVHTRARGRLMWGMSPLAANLLTMLNDPRRDLNPLGGEFLGSPAIVTDGLAGRRIALIDASAIAGSVGGMSVDAVRHATIEMGDQPSSAASSQVSLFQTNSTAVKVQLTLGIETIRDDAVAFIEIGGES